MNINISNVRLEDIEIDDNDSIEGFVVKLDEFVGDEQFTYNLIITLIESLIYEESDCSKDLQKCVDILEQC